MTKEKQEALLYNLIEKIKTSHKRMGSKIIPSSSNDPLFEVGAVTAEIGKIAVHAQTVLDEAKQDFPLDEIRKDIRQQCLHMGNADPVLLKVRSWFINHFGGVDEAQRKNEYYTDDSTRL